MKLAKRAEVKVRASWPLMVLHRAITGDKQQYGLWKQRVERIIQTYRLSRTRSSLVRKIVAHKPAWRRARGFGRLGTFVVMGAACSFSYGTLAANGWFSHLGTWPYLILALPLLPALLIAKRSLENAALTSMASTHGKSEGARRRSATFSGVLNSFLAGFTGGFTLLFLAGLLSWFPNPAPTLAMELWLDTTLALQAGVLVGSVTAPLGLLLGISPVNPNELPAAPTPVALLTE